MTTGVPPAMLPIQGLIPVTRASSRPADQNMIKKVKVKILLFKILFKVGLVGQKKIILFASMKAL